MSSMNFRNSREGIEGLGEMSERNLLRLGVYPLLMRKLSEFPDISPQFVPSPLVRGRKDGVQLEI